MICLQLNTLAAINSHSVSILLLLRLVLDAQKHTFIPISSIFSVDMIVRQKDFTIANVWLKPCYTTNDDIRLGSVNEVQEFIFPSTYTLKVYCYDSKVGGMGLDWLHVLRWL